MWFYGKVKFKGSLNFETFFYCNDLPYSLVILESFEVKVKIEYRYETG